MSPLTSDFFLSTGDVERLTGKKRYSAQVRWLLDHGYKCDVNGLGMPIVAVEEVNRKLVGGAVRRKFAEPNWAAMDPSFREADKKTPVGKARPRDKSPAKRKAPLVIRMLPSIGFPDPELHLPFVMDALRKRIAEEAVLPAADLPATDAAE